MDKPIKLDERLFEVEVINQETGMVMNRYKEQGLKNALIRSGNLIEIHAAEVTISITQAKK